MCFSIGRIIIIMIPGRFNIYNINKIEAARRDSINRTKNRDKKERSKSIFTTPKFRCIIVLIGLATRKAYNRLGGKNLTEESRTRYNIFLYFIISSNN